MDLGSLMEEFIDAAQSTDEHQLDGVYQKPMIYDMVNALSSSETIENDLASFKTYLEQRLKDPEDPLYNAVSGYSTPTTPSCWCTRKMWTGTSSSPTPKS